ncbi:MAG: c-type cytochrome [Gemmatimonadaceae bacterium]
MRRTPVWLTVALLAAAPAALAGQGAPVAQAAPGKPLYLKNCRSCHGRSGQPTKQALRETPKIPTMDAAFLAKRSTDSLLAVLQNGAGKDMKSFRSKLSRDEMQAIVAYLREAFGTAGEDKRSP